MSGEKTEKPTPRRRQEARREGRVARTPDLAAWLGVLLATFLLPAVGSSLRGQLQELMVQVAAVTRHPDVDQALLVLRSGMSAGVRAAVLLGGVLMVAALAVNAAQGGIRFAAKPIRPQASRLNPLSGLKRMFGPHSLWETAKALLKTAVVGLLVYQAVRAALPLVEASGAVPLPGLLAAAGDSLTSLARGVAVVGLVLAVPDYLVAKRRVDRHLKMSRQDIRDEMRQSEGDPQLKGALRSRQLAMSRMRMMAEVVRADVILVNPTHVAVALRYESARGAPRVVAKGAGVVAARIRERAAEARVPMVQDVPLARSVYHACDLGQEIPPQLYLAVAQVLAFVMSLRSRGSAAGTHRVPVGQGARR